MTATHLLVVWQRDTDGVRHAQGTRQGNRQSAICPLQHANLFNQIPQIPSCIPTEGRLLVILQNVFGLIFFHESV